LHCDGLLNRIAELAIVATFVCGFCPGVYLIYAGYNGGTDGLPGSGDGGNDAGVGIALCVVSMVLMCLLCYIYKQIKMCIAALRAATVFMTHCWTMFAEPLINFALRAVIWTLMIIGLVWIISVGNVDTTKVYKSFKYTPEEVIFIVFYIIMMSWINDICSACHEYVVGNCVGKWYFTEHDTPEDGGMKSKVPWCLMLTAYCSVSLRLGSLCKGALFTTFFRPVRIILSFFVYPADIIEQCVCLKWICCGATDGCREIMIKYSKIPFITMGMDPDLHYSEAAADGYEFVTEEADKKRTAHFLKNRDTKKMWKIPMITRSGRMVMLARTQCDPSEHTEVEQSIRGAMGVCWLFCAGGTLAMSAFSGLLVFAVVKLFEPWNEPLDPRYVEDPVALAIVSGFFGYLVAVCFMMQYDLVVDSLLICLSKDLSEMMERQYIPTIPRNLLETNMALEEPTQTIWQKITTMSMRAPPMQTEIKAEPAVWDTNPMAPPWKRRDYCPLQLKVMFPNYFPHLWERE
jgi:hypothetical protein